MLRHKGFTLIELLITVAIIGILAAIALPSYTAYVQRSRITEAVSGLSSMSVNLERFYQDNRSYQGACAASTVAPLATGTYFTFSCALPVPVPPATPTYVVTAAGNAGGPMASFSYTIDQDGTKLTTGLPAGWAYPATNCWALKSDGSC